MTKFKVPKIEEMLDAGVHFGHQVRRWNPKMEPYIYTVSRNSHIIDLEQTETLLKNACDYLYETAKSGGVIVFVGTKKQARDIISSEAKRCGALFVNERWVGGTITNFKNIRRTLDKFLGFIKGKDEGRFDAYTKKERLLIDRQIEKFQTFYGGIASLKTTPSALFVIDPKREKTAVREAKSAGIKVVSLIDTNGDPAGIDYLIPGNDDAIKSIALIVKTLSDAVTEGYADYQKELEKNKVAAAKPVVDTTPKDLKVEKGDKAEKSEKSDKTVKTEKPVKSDKPKEVKTSKEVKPVKKPVKK